MAKTHNENVRNEILNVVEDLLNKKSFSDISLSDIASLTNISKGTLYYYFKTKEDLLFAIMDRYLEKQWQDFIDWTTDISKDTSIHRLIKYVLECDNNNGTLRFSLIFEAASNNPKAKEKLLERYHRFHRFIADSLIDKTDIDANYLAWLILFLSDEMAVNNLLNNPYISNDEFIKETKLII